VTNLIALIDYNVYIAIVVFLSLLLVHLYTLVYMMSICMLTACWWWLPCWRPRVRRSVRRLAPHFWYVVMITILLHYYGFRIYHD
jgi:hypothetical protein